jgi:hypothetical protein
VDNIRDVGANKIKPANHRFVVLGKSYFEGRIACHFHFVIWVARERCVCNLCADFEVMVPAKSFNVGGGNTVEGPALEREVSGENQDFVHDAVFVRVGKVTQDGEDVFRRVRSMVRLKPLDLCPMAAKHVFEGIVFRKLFRDDILARGLDCDWEPSSASPTSREFRSSGLDAGELPNEMIEDAPQVMDAVSGNQPEAEQFVFGKCRNPKDVIAGLVVELGAQGYRIALRQEVGENFGIEGVSMFPRPLDLRPTAAEIGLVGHDCSVYQKRLVLTHFPLPYQNPPFTPVFLCQNPCQNQSINASPTRWFLTLSPRGLRALHIPNSPGPTGQGAYVANRGYAPF